MRLIGLDAGTTSVSGVLLNGETGQIEKVATDEHEANLRSDASGVDIQDPEKIYIALERTIGALLDTTFQETATAKPDEDVFGVSITGQVHGILYFDDYGKHVSPLYTWQDSRGRQPKNTSSPTISWSDWATERSGYWLPPGYGFLTHLINLAEGRVPQEAAGMATILGYLSMRLAGVDRPLLEATDAHSLGVFDLSSTSFDRAALKRLGVKQHFIPEVVPTGTAIGKTCRGIPVFASVGDNQAGFVGAVRNCTETLLVSIGTSSQLSAYTTTLPEELETRTEPARFAGWLGTLETRPYPGGGFLLSGAAISGGSAYRLLERFFRQICRTYGAGDPGSLLEKMNAIPYDELDVQLKLDVSTQFLGTRTDPGKRASIGGVGTSNFTPDYLVEGFLRGIVEEVAEFYEQFREATGRRSDAAVGVGNALRRNPLLRRILKDKLRLPILLTAQREEAAFGAAIVAGVGAGIFGSYTSPDRPIRYEEQEPYVSTKRSLS